jgi:hypothetical protein
MEPYAWKKKNDYEAMEAALKDYWREKAKFWRMVIQTEKKTPVVTHQTNDYTVRVNDQNQLKIEQDTYTTGGNKYQDWDVTADYRGDHPFNEPTWDELHVNVMEMNGRLGEIKKELTSLGLFHPFKKRALKKENFVVRCFMEEAFQHQRHAIIELWQEIVQERLKPYLEEYHKTPLTAFAKRGNLKAFVDYYQYYLQILPKVVNRQEQPYQAKKFNDLFDAYQAATREYPRYHQDEK